MSDTPREDLINEEVAFNLVTISAVVEYLEGKFPGAKEEIYALGRNILAEHEMRHSSDDADEG